MKINGIQKLYKYSIRVDDSVYRIHEVENLTNVSEYPIIERICKELKHQPGFYIRLHDWYEAPVYAFVSYELNGVDTYVWMHVVTPFDPTVSVKKVRWDMVKTYFSFLAAFSQGRWASSDIIKTL
jgi:hypothetical protein